MNTFDKSKVAMAIMPEAITAEPVNEDVLD